LIVDDPDAPRGTFVHWVLWNIPADTRMVASGSAPAEASRGMNDFGRPEYGGPCPPAGTHRYFFKLYALDTMLNLSPATNKAGLENAMKRHVLGQAELVGLYKRK
jgi:Raf kinase inhibitor-like YbhB/YbcL family protein